MIDATPDFASQVHDLTGGAVPDGILLTHAHIGHYTGLMYLGRESIDAKAVPVFGTERMRTGSIYDVVEVLKSLTFLSKSKSLSFREKRMLDRAKFLVVSEISEVLAEKTPAVEEKVEKALERCFAMKARNAARAKAAAAARTTKPPVARVPPRRAARAS